ncbi:MAG TPA: ZIP family metal transporter [Tepidisphaeraceae bacterium]|jgi:zinc transporter ZupT|nr:ZIP family metal transporter [Tepidisphaeraceae bacterium]
MTALLFSFLTFFSTALGGLFALHRRRQLYLVMGLAAGILVAAALLDLLPDALHLAHESGQSSTRRILAAAVVGFLAFWGLDRLMHRAAAGHEHRHEHPHETIAFGSIAALGLTIHSFLDGFAIGSAFQASSSTGFLVAIAVIAHDFGDGVSTVGVVLGSRGKLVHSLGWLLADATAPVVGCAAALVLSISPGRIAELLGFFAGSFLFIGAAHLLPEAEHEGRAGWLYVAVLAGVGVVILARLLGG